MIAESAPSWPSSRTQRYRSVVGLGEAVDQRAEGGAEVAAGGRPADRGGGRPGCLLAGDQPGQPQWVAAPDPVQGGERAEPAGSVQASTAGRQASPDLGRR